MRARHTGRLCDVVELLLSFVVTSVIFDAVLVTAFTTCCTTHVSPIPSVNTTCNAPLIMCPTRSPMRSRTPQQRCQILAALVVHPRCRSAR